MDGGVGFKLGEREVLGPNCGGVGHIQRLETEREWNSKDCGEFFRVRFDRGWW